MCNEKSGTLAINILVDTFMYPICQLYQYLEIVTKIVFESLPNGIAYKQIDNPKRLVFTNCFHAFFAFYSCRAVIYN